MKLPKRKRREKTFLRYLLTYALILLVPVAAASFLLGKYFVEDFRAELVQGNVDAVQSAKTAADREFRQIYNLLNLFEYSESFRPQKTMGSDYDRIQFNQQFSQLIASEDLIAHVLYYPRGGDKVFSSLGTYKPEDLPKTALKHQNWPAEAFVQTVKSATAPMWVPSDMVTAYDIAPVRYFVRVEPIPYMSTHPYATILFYISQDRFEKVLQTTGNLPGGTALLLYGDGELVAFMGMNSIPADQSGVENALAAQPLTPGKAEEITIGGTTYLASVASSDIIDITYVRLTDASAVYAGVNQRIMLVAGVLFATLIAGGALIYLSMYLNYRPLRRLKTTLQTSVPEKAQPGWDIVETAENTIITLQNSHKELDAQLAQSRASIKHHLLLRLVKGDFHTPEAFALESGQAGIALHPYFVVATLQMTAPGCTPANMLAGIAAVEGLSGGDVALLGTVGAGEQSAIFVLSAAAPAVLDAFPVEMVQLCMEEAAGCGCTVGFGNMYADIAMARTGFVEAKTALEYRFVQGAGRIIRFADTCLEQPGEFLRQYPREDLDLLGVAIKNRDFAAVTTLLDKLENRLCQMQAPLFQVKYLCFSIIDRMTDSFSQLQSQMEVHLGLEDIISLMEDDTMEGLMEHLRALCSQIASVPLIPAGDGGFAEQVYAYIRQNGQADGYYVSAIAAAMGMTVSNLSHRFKKSAGISLSAYLAGVRLEHSRDLLQSTNASVGEIAEKMGYANVSSYIKVFKKAVGLTPGEYRRLYGHTSPSGKDDTP